jgi:hypothetical protein
MLQIVTRFLTFDVLSTHPAVYWGLALVWIILLVAAFASVRSLEIHVAGKVVWIVVILFVPILGLACYAFRCLVRGEWSFLKPFLVPARTIRQVSPH